MHDDQVMVEEFRQLLKIPSFKLILGHKIEELKILLSEDISNYKEIEIMLQGKSKPGRDQNRLVPKGDTAFRLTAVGESLWIPSLESGDGGDAFQLVPDPLIRFMVNTKSRPGLITAEAALELPELPGQRFKLYFERPSPTLITGIVSTRIVDQKKFDRSRRQSPHGRMPAELYAKSGEPVNFVELKEFFQYIIHSPVMYNYMMTQFQLVWKPLVDNQEQKSS